MKIKRDQNIYLVGNTEEGIKVSKHSGYTIEHNGITYGLVEVRQPEYILIECASGTALLYCTFAKAKEMIKKFEKMPRQMGEGDKVMTYADVLRTYQTNEYYQRNRDLIRVFKEQEAQQ